MGARVFVHVCSVRVCSRALCKCGHMHSCVWCPQSCVGAFIRACKRHSIEVSVQSFDDSFIQRYVRVCVGAWVRVRMRAMIFPAFAGFFRTRYSKRITQSASTVPMPMAIMILRFVSYVQTQECTLEKYSMRAPVPECLSERASERMRVCVHKYVDGCVRAFVRVSE